jgi:SAM-dependent methyltransferase
MAANENSRHEMFAEQRMTKSNIAFDRDYYRQNSDLAAFSDDDLRRHFLDCGLDEGRPGAAQAAREVFLTDLPQDGPVLEIGPFHAPSVTGKNVKYADVLTTEQLRERAISLGHSADQCPHIDFHLPDFSISSIDQKFSAVVSSHCIEHQPDLVQHLIDVEGLLLPGGKYFLMIPDKRFCFDHFLSESSIADVVSAHERKLKVHDISSIIEHWALTTHNDPCLHWAGDHGRQRIEDSIRPLEVAIADRRASPGTYIDVHAWQFTPGSFYQIIDLLNRLNLISFRPQAVYNTVHNRNEFCAVLGA